jgi:ubiquinone/menaquinone biosynthesis C-methylase UbiE
MAYSLSFDRVADRYDATRHYPPEVAARISAELIRLGNVPPGGAMLEIGIGTGRIALPLLAKGVQVTGVDISDRMVARLRAKYEAARAADPDRTWGVLDVELVDMTALPFAEDRFDVAVAVHVLHLVPQWRHALDEAVRVVKPGGAFLLGQDVRNDRPRNLVHDEWDVIVRELGYIPDPPGAHGHTAVVEELRSRGLDVQEHVLATWQDESVPRIALETITQRLFSRTWAVPDDLFAESAQRLTAWAEREFGDGLDTPQRATYSFKVAVAGVP